MEEKVVLRELVEVVLLLMYGVEVVVLILVVRKEVM